MSEHTMAVALEKPESRADLALFLLIAFGGSFAFAGTCRLAGVKYEGVGAMFVGGVYMWFPAIAAFVVEKRRGVKVRETLGIKVDPNPWWVFGWLFPLFLAWLAFAVGLSFPGTGIVAGTSGFLDKFTAQIPPDKMVEAKEKLSHVPMPVFLGITVVQALVAGPSINAVVAFGEELGWRGFLDRRLRPLGFWKGAFVTGLLWGPWHAPLILQGHNYPHHRVLGIALMTVMTVLLSPLFSAVRRGGRSVLASAIAHGSVNATAGFGSMLLTGGSDVRTGLTGIAGFIALIAADVALWLWLRAHPLPDDA